MNKRSIPTRLTRHLALFLCSWKVGVPVVVLLLCLGSLFQFRRSRLSGVPDIGHPFDIEEWGHVEVDPAENAAIDYETAALLYRGHHEPSSDDLDIVWERGWSEASPDVQTWLEDNRDALQAWQVGTARNVHLRVQPAEMTMENGHGSISKLRGLQRLAWLEAERLRFLGDTDAAWQWHRASLRFSRHVGMNASLIDRTIGSAFYDLTVDRVVAWARDEDVTSDQLAQALADALKVWVLSSHPSTSVRAEYFVACNELVRLEEHREDYDAVADFAETLNPRLPENMRFTEGPRLPPRWRLFLWNEPELTRRLLQHQIANLLETADEPLFQQPDLLPGDVDYFMKPAVDSDRLSADEFRRALDNSLLGDLILLRRTLRFIHRERVHHGLLGLVLAAEWHRRETGALPATIDELLTGPMLDEIPLDAFSRSGDALKYERDPDNTRRAKVWSVGPNGVDDGGSLEHVFVPYPGRPDLGYWIGEPEATVTEK